MKLLITTLTFMFISFVVIGDDEIEPVYEDNTCFLILPSGNDFFDSFEVMRKCKKGNIIAVSEFSKLENLSSINSFIDIFVSGYCDFNKQIKIKYPFVGNPHSSLMCVYNGFNYFKSR